jgi:HNH endonuclease
MTKKEIRESIIGCAAELKHVPSLEEVLKMTPVSHRQIIRHFGGYIAALRNTGLELKSTVGRGHAVPMEKLLADWCGVVQKVKKIPSITEYQLLSNYSSDPLMRRFGKWLQVPHGLKQFAEKHGLAKKWKRELALVQGTPAPGTNRTAPEIHHNWPAAMFDRPLYGSPMWAWPMAYSPVNELGVIFLFGAMSWQLGFIIHKLQAEFPDCEAMRRVSEDRCQLVKIEFELESRNFLKHMHDPSKCDLIVCWRHNWPECPLEVLELRKLLPEVPGLPKIEN